MYEILLNLMEVPPYRDSVYHEPTARKSGYVSVDEEVYQVPSPGQNE